MTECNQFELDFPSCKRRKVEASFTGGEVTSDAGVLLLRQADRKLGLTTAVAGALTDSRRKKSCEHSFWPRLSVLKKKNASALLVSFTTRPVRL